MIVYGIWCLTCLFAFWYSARVDRYVRTKYPAIWNSFGFSRTSEYSEDEHQLLDLIAQQRYHTFLRSKARHACKDSTLNRMLRIREICIGLAIITSIAVVIRFMLYIESMLMS